MKQHSNIKGHKGLTLVELIIAMALSLIITTAVTSMYVLVLNLTTRLSGEKNVIQRSRIIMDNLSEDVGKTDVNKATITSLTTNSSSF